MPADRACCRALAQQVVFVMVPPLLLIFLVLGTIFIGVATPTEGGAMGAVGAMLLALGKRLSEGNPARFSIEIVRSATQATAKLSAFVMFILIGARIFSLTFYGVNGHLWVEHLLISLPGGEVGFLIVVNVLVFFLAFFLDFFELAFIIVPLLAPAAHTLGIDLVWFGVILAVNMQTSFMHPPFGFALFYLRSVAPRVPYVDKVTGKTMPAVTTGQIYWGAVPYVVIQLIMVGLLIAFPGLVRHDAPPAPQQRALPAAGDASPAFKDQGFSLSPYPPAIPGAPPPETTGPGAPDTRHVRPAGYRAAVTGRESEPAPHPTPAPCAAGSSCTCRRCARRAGTTGNPRRGWRSSPRTPS